MMDADFTAGDDSLLIQAASPDDSRSGALRAHRLAAMFMAKIQAAQRVACLWS